MLFELCRTSNERFDDFDCNKLKKLGIEYSLKNSNSTLKIEVESIEQLYALVEEYGEIIIGPWMDLEIYDTYRE